MQLYLEGDKRLRPSMSQFIRRATGSIDLKITPCRSRDDAIKQCAKDVGAVLLIDSEGPISTQLVDRVAAQVGVINRAFFMVQLMESWFLADRQSLARYFGSEFRVNSLPGNPNVEEIPKQDVLDGLHSATRSCRKGTYNKTTHATALLERLDASVVYTACPNFARLIDFLAADAGASR